jgi:alkylated DNA repair dioxygenase AlkB
MESMIDLLGYLKDSGDFVQEKGHGVRVFGQPYSYTGSRSSNYKPEQIPPKISSIIDRISDELKLVDKPNSVLINHYPSRSPSDQHDSHLAMHSDDEPSIVPESKILTISIGASRKVVFKEKHDDTSKPVELTVQHNSLYTMSRSSQNWFRHGVPSPTSDQEVDERFSITLRTLKKQSRRSVVLIGDSNTKEVNFGSGSGKVGESYPGKRIKASRVKDIEPNKCIGYSNAFIMCGTNDLRCENVRSESDIHNLVDQLRLKLCDIRQLCPETKLFVIPVIPTKIPKMNSHIVQYNDLVDDMLMTCFPEIWFEGVYGFLDQQNELSTKLCRGSDKIHLGPHGISKLVSYMKTLIFRREKYESPKSPSRSSPQKSTQEVGSTEPT